MLVTSTAVNGAQSRYGSDSKFVARNESTDVHAGSVEQSPSWFSRNKWVGCVGVLALASSMLVGCDETQNAAPQQEQSHQTQVANPTPAPLTACQQLKVLSSQPAPTDPTLAQSAKADRDLAQANCQLEISQKQADAAQKMADAAQKQAAAQQQQADIAKRQEQIRNAEAAGEVAGALGSAIGQGINSILH